MDSNSRGERLTIYFNQSDPLISHERGKRFLLMLLSIGSSDWVYNTRLDWIISCNDNLCHYSTPDLVGVHVAVFKWSGKTFHGNLTIDQH